VFCQWNSTLTIINQGEFHMTKFEDESDLIDGILQPGGHLRVPMFMKDGSINPSLNSVQRSIAATRQRDTATFDAASHRPVIDMRAAPTTACTNPVFVMVSPTTRLNELTPMRTAP
jgi:hypothetical protein